MDKEKDSGRELSLEQLLKTKIEDRKRLLEMPPKAAQKLVEKTLYSTQWDLEILAEAWQENFFFISEALKNHYFTIIDMVQAKDGSRKTEMDKLTPSELKDIILKLQESLLDAIVVGGQAVNLYAYRYYKKCPQLSQYLPFAREDLDFYGGKLEVILCSEILKGKAILNTNFNPSPNTGVVLIQQGKRQLRIDFLGSVFGLSDTEITETALTLEGKGELIGVRLKVLHPLLCLEGKLRALGGLPQGGRQDLKHVKMMIICLQAYIQEILPIEETRSLLKLVERILKGAMNEDGLMIWYQHQILLEEVIPLNNIRELTDERWQKFCQIRLPLAVEQINRRRIQYRDIMKRITVKKEEK